MDNSSLVIFACISKRGSCVSFISRLAFNGLFSSLVGDDLAYSVSPIFFVPCAFPSGLNN